MALACQSEESKDVATTHVGMVSQIAKPGSVLGDGNGDLYGRVVSGRAESAERSGKDKSDRLALPAQKRVSLLVMGGRLRCSWIMDF